MVAPAGLVRGPNARRAAAAGSAPSVRSSQLSSRTSNNTSDVFTAPSPIVNGDLLICVHAKDFIALDGLFPPSGFNADIPDLTEATDNSSGSGSNGARSEVSRKTASGESGNYTATTSQAERFAGWMGAIAGTSGVDDAAETIQTSTGSTNMVMPQVTTTVANCLLLYIVCQDDNSGTIAFTEPGEITEVAQQSVSSAAALFIGYEVQAAAGLSAARTIVSNTADSYVTRTIAFKP